MGIFDFFKEGDNFEGDGQHQKRGLRKSSFNANDFSNNAELVSWLEHNKTILMSEDDGLVVYTDDNDENFLQIYSSTDQATDEELSEYVEVDGNDLKDLFEEMPDIAYVVLNPNTDNFIISRDELLYKKDFKTYDRKPSESESQSLSMKGMMDYQVTSASDSLGESKESLSEKAEEKSESEKIATKSEKEEDPFAENGLLTDFARTTPKRSARAEQIPVVPVVPVAPVVAAEAGKDSEISTDKNDQKINKFSLEEGNKKMNYRKVSEVPSSIIEKILQFKEDGVTKFYLGEVVSDSAEKAYALLLNVESIHALTSAPNTKILLQDGSDDAQVLENSDFLVYDEAAVHSLGNDYTEASVLDYFQENKIIYTVPQSHNASEKEVNAFTDFSKIPELFVKSFDSFNIASFADFADFLEQDKSLQFVHLNQFTKSLYITREVAIAHKHKAPTPPKQVSSNVLDLVYTDDKGTALVYVVSTLKDFSLKNLEIGDDAERKLRLTFNSQQDADIAKQVLKLKTDYKIN